MTARNHKLRAFIFKKHRIQFHQGFLNFSPKPLLYGLKNHKLCQTLLYFYYLCTQKKQKTRQTRKYENK